MIVRVKTRRSRRPPSLSRTVLLWSEGFFLVIGFLCLGYVGFSMGKAYVYQSYESYQLEQSLQGKEATITGYLRGFTESSSTAPPPPPVYTTKGAPKLEVDPGLIGRVEIPRLDISAMVREGVDSGTLSRAVGHVPRTALPGSRGNVAIAAHRDTFFRNVRNIQRGDRIRMITQRGTYEYAVDSLKIVAPTEVRVLDPTPENTITLVTCYPFNYVGSAPKRFIVRARQVPADGGLSASSARSLSH